MVMLLLMIMEVILTAVGIGLQVVATHEKSKNRRQ
jgi:hypothetical protein